VDNGLYPAKGKRNLKMDFKEGQAIYLQIAEHVCEKILLKELLQGSKIISIRDMAVQIEVNPNTVQRAYDFLQQNEIITNKRGIGYFVSEQAIEKARAVRKDQFIESELVTFFRSMYLLDIPIAEIELRYKKYIDQNFKDKNA
jgi:GntR family transcriptional regulator